MLAVLSVLLWLIGVVLALVLLAVATPIHLALSAELGPAPRLCLRLRLFGGATPQFRIVDTSRSPSAPVPEAAASTRAPARRGRRRQRRKAGRWRLPEGAAGRLLRALPDFLRREIRRIHIDRLSLDGDIGLGDPADTGRLFGYIMPLCHALHLPRTRIDLRPDFSRSRLDGRADAALHFTPLSLMVPVLQLGWRVLAVGR